MNPRLLLPAMISLLILLAACSTPAGSDDQAADPSTADPSTADATGAGAEPIAVTVSDFMIDPNEIELAGTTLTIDVTNDGPTPHNLSVRDESDEIVLATEDLGAGESETITGELEPGTYTIFCSLAGHESLGMAGTLTVTAP